MNLNYWQVLCIGFFFGIGVLSVERLLEFLRQPFKCLVETLQKRLILSDSNSLEQEYKTYSIWSRLELEGFKELIETNQNRVLDGVSEQISNISKYFPDFDALKEEIETQQKELLWDICKRLDSNKTEVIQEFYKVSEYIFYLKDVLSTDESLAKKLNNFKPFDPLDENPTISELEGI